MAAHPPVSVPDSGMRQNELVGVHVSLFDDKEGGGNADSTSQALIQEEKDLDTRACSTREDSDSWLQHGVGSPGHLKHLMGV